MFTITALYLIRTQPSKKQSPSGRRAQIHQVTSETPDFLSDRADHKPGETLHASRDGNAPANSPFSFLRADSNSDGSSPQGGSPSDILSPFRDLPNCAD